MDEAQKKKIFDMLTMPSGGWQRMDQAAKEAWVAALRSGEYTQTRETLDRVDMKTGVRCNCCLGVIARIEGVKEGERDGDGDLEFRFGAGFSRSVTPLGFKGIGYYERAALTYMNDHGMPFADIADWIEENL